MRLEFEPNVTAIPLVENELFDEEPTPGSHDFQLILKRGIAAAQSGERESARSLLARSTEMEPQSETAWMWLASVSEYPEELLAFLHNVLQINPYNERALEWHRATETLIAKTLVQRGVDAQTQGSTDLARHFFEQALDHDEACEMAWFWMADMASSDEERTKCFHRVVEINPANAEANKALDDIKTAALQMTLDTAKKAAIAGDHQKAVSIIDEVLSERPSDVDTWILRSHLAADLREKLVSLERVLEIDPDNAMARSSHEFLTTSMAATDPSPAAFEHVEEQSINTFSEEITPVEVQLSDPVYEEVTPVEEQLSDPIYEEAAPVAPENEWKDPEEPIEETFESDETVFADNEISEPGFSVVTDEYNFAHVDDESTYFETEVDEVIEVESPFFVEDVDEISNPILVEENEETSVVAFDEPADTTEHFSCPYCMSANEGKGFQCDSCHAALTLSDIESLLSNPKADVDIIQPSVTEMEAEWNQREFNENELTVLAIGHFNLRNFDRGFKYLQEASRLDPNNVILAGQTNAIAIRLEEIRRQDETPDNSPKGKSILVVDDSATVRKLIAGKLEKSGHNVVCAVDGVDGLARLAEALPDLVLLDIGMPRMDGYEVCREIRANPEAKDLPVVMISGKDGFFDKVRGRMAGATGYVTKPFGPETLMKALETYLIPETTGQ